jgi:hypothetical protein
VKPLNDKSWQIENIDGEKEEDSNNNDKKSKKDESKGYEIRN